MKFKLTTEFNIPDDTPQDLIDRLWEDFSVIISEGRLPTETSQIIVKAYTHGEAADVALRHGFGIMPVGQFRYYVKDATPSTTIEFYWRFPWDPHQVIKSNSELGSNEFRFLKWRGESNAE